MLVFNNHGCKLTQSIIYYINNFTNLQLLLQKLTNNSIQQLLVFVIMLLQYNNGNFPDAVLLSGQCTEWIRSSSSPVMKLSSSFSLLHDNTGDDLYACWTLACHYCRVENSLFYNLVFRHLEKLSAIFYQLFVFFLQGLHYLFHNLFC